MAEFVALTGHNFTVVVVLKRAAEWFRGEGVKHRGVGV